MVTLNKEAIVRALRAQLQAELEALTDSQRRAQEGAVHEESRPENDKDTRATEASYLARGLAKRVQEMRGVQSAFAALKVRSFTEDDDIRVGALVTLEDEEENLSYLLIAPKGGGLSVTFEGVLVRVVTPESPVGSAVMGMYVDDDVKFRTPRDGDKEAVIVGLC